MPTADLRALAERLAPCACGCGQSVRTPDRWGREMRYARGHHGPRDAHERFWSKVEEGEEVGEEG